MLRTIFANVYFFLAKDRKTASPPPRPSVSFPPHHFCFCSTRRLSVKQQKQYSHHGEAGGRRNVSLLCCHERRWACGGSGPVVSRLGGAPFCSCAERGLPEVVSNWVSLWAGGRAGWVAGPPFPHTWSVRQSEQHRPWLFPPPGSVRRLWPEAPWSAGRGQAPAPASSAADR